MGEPIKRVTPEYVRLCIREKSYLDKAITLDELKLQLERDYFDDLISLGLSVGMEYSEIMKLDNKRFYKVYKGKLKYLERLSAISEDLNKIQAIKISQALFDSDGFNKVNDRFRLTPENTLEKSSRLANENKIPREVIRENILKG